MPRRDAARCGRRHYPINPTLHPRTTARTRRPNSAPAGALQRPANGGCRRAAGCDKFDDDNGVAAAMSASLPIRTGDRVPAAIRAAQGNIAAGLEIACDCAASLLTTMVGT